MKPFIDLQMLQDATRRWRSSKATKQTRTPRCKTFKCCKMLLEDEGDKCDFVVASTLHHCARLLKYYLRRPCAPSFVKSRTLHPLQTHFLFFNKYSLSLYVYPWGLGCLLGFWPLGQNPVGTKIQLWLCLAVSYEDLLLMSYKSNVSAFR